MNNLTISVSFLPHTDPDASVTFYRDVLGFEVRLDVGVGPMRWVTVGSVNQPDTAIVLHPPTAQPGLTKSEKATIAELMAKGTFFGINLASRTLDATFERLGLGSGIGAAS